jgi:TRAP-type mannitol/chloroaromatic compound transport system substrate-binding protein
MFKLFKKKSKVDKLNEKYNALLKEAYELSTSNRMLSDAKTAEANEVLKQIEQIEKKN